MKVGDPCECGGVYNYLWVNSKGERSVECPKCRSIKELPKQPLKKDT